MSEQQGVNGRIRREMASYSDLKRFRAILEVVVVALCIGFSLMPMLPAYGTVAALYAVIAGVSCGALSVLVGAFRRWPLPITLLVGFGVYVVTGGIVAFGRELIAGFVPSGHSITSLLVGIVTSWKEALTLEPPLGSHDGVLVLPFLVAFLGSFLASLIVVWRRSWTTTILATLVVALFLIIGILWGTQEAVLGPFVGLAVFAVMIVWASGRMGVWRPKRWIPFTVFLAVLITSSSLVVPQLESDNPRFVLRSIVVPPFDPRDQISPLAIYRSYLKDQADVPLVTVDGMPAGALIRLATLDSYDGVVWSVSGDQSRAGSGAFRRIGNEIDQQHTGDPYDVTITIEGLDGVWTPTIGYLSQIDFEKSGATDFRFNDATGAGVSIGGVTKGTTYRVSGVIPQDPSDEELGEVGVGKISIADVSNVPEIVGSKAVSIASEAANVPLVVRKFEQYLNTRGFFSHGEATGDYPSLSGHGADRIADLFAADIMVGDAEQYASAMALLARSQGIPARVVVGFIPEEDASTATFTGADLTAWVEVYYNEYGWVSYFPTPPDSQTPQDSDVESEPEPEPEALQLPPDPKPPVAPPAVNSEDTDVEAEEDPAGISIDWGYIAAVTAAVGLPLVVIIGVPLLIIAAKTRRRLRRKRQPGAYSVVGGWQEIVDQALDLGITPDSDFTRRETARFIEAGERSFAVRKLADAADKAHFGAGPWSSEETADFWADVEYSSDKLGRSVSWRRRLRARLSLRSIRAERARLKVAQTESAPEPARK